MHASQLAELGGWLAVDKSGGMETRELGELLGDRYWTHSRSRLKRWNKALQMFTDDIARDDDQHNPWPAVQIVAEEIIISELLTRVWSAVVIQSESKFDSSELSSIAHSILVGHVEARNRAFKLLLDIPHWAQPTAEKLNQLRRTIERWTDLLLSHLPDQKSAATFAFCQKRLGDYSASKSGSPATARRAEQLLLASLTADLKRLASKFPANPEINRRIAAGILASFSNVPFDASSMPAATWMMQVDSFQDNAQELLQQLFADEDAGSPAAGKNHFGLLQRGRKRPDKFSPN